MAKKNAAAPLSMADRDGWIWYDGKMVPWRNATTHVLTHTLHYGLGVFEGVRAYKTVDGPAIFRGPVVSPLVSDGLLAVAGEHDIVTCIETGRFTSSDADEIFGAAGGIATGMVSIPLRSMHSAHEVADLGDIDATSRLLEAYARSLGPDDSFLR